MIQLRQIFAQQKDYLCIYNRDEIIIHELVHVGMMFAERRFEEVFAYETSSSAFRRWFGPLIQLSHGKAASFLLMILAGDSFSSLTFFFSAVGHHEAFEYGSCIELHPSGADFDCFGQAFCKAQTDSKCLERLEICLQCGQKARAVAYRLTDKEVVAFGNFSGQNTGQYARMQSREELRWRTIVAYFC